MRSYGRSNHGTNARWNNDSRITWLCDRPFMLLVRAFLRILGKDGCDIRYCLQTIAPKVIVIVCWHAEEVRGIFVTDQCKRQMELIALILVDPLVGQCTCSSVPQSVERELYSDYAGVSAHISHKDCWFGLWEMSACIPVCFSGLTHFYWLRDSRLSSSRSCVGILEHWVFLCLV